MDYLMYTIFLSFLWLFSTCGFHISLKSFSKDCLIFVIVDKKFPKFSTKRVQIPFCPKNSLKISTDFYFVFDKIIALKPLT